MDILVHIKTQVSQLNGQTFGQGRVELDIPIILGSEVRLDIFGTRLKSPSLPLFVVGMHVRDRHEEDIDEHRQHRRQDDIGDTRRKTHIPETPVTDQHDDTDQNDESEQHMA